MKKMKKALKKILFFFAVLALIIIIGAILYPLTGGQYGLLIIPFMKRFM